MESKDRVPHDSNAITLWNEHDKHDNFPLSGGWYDQTPEWREDQDYINMWMMVVGIEEDIEHANTSLKQVKKRKGG